MKNDVDVHRQEPPDRFFGREITLRHFLNKTFFGPRHQHYRVIYTSDINIVKLIVMNILNKLSVRFRIWEPHVRHVLYLFHNHKVNDPEHKVTLWRRLGPYGPTYGHYSTLTQLVFHLIYLDGRRQKQRE